MTKYQVTALFGNKYEIVGGDEVDYGTALGLFRVYENTGRTVRIHVIDGNSSRVIKEAN